MKTYTLQDIEKHLCELKACASCPNMIGPVVTPRPVLSKVYLVGQAPGPREGELGRPFAWTAGKRMFSWFETLGMNEEEFRSRIYMSAVCRCFPGKAKQGGDRVPSPEEIKQCSKWMQREIDMLKPELVIAVGRLAIEQFLPGKELLNEVVGKKYRLTAFNHTFDMIALPHPSGASTWFHREPGKTLTYQALQMIGEHSAFAPLVSKQKDKADDVNVKISSGEQVTKQARAVRTKQNDELDDVKLKTSSKQVAKPAPTLRTKKK